MSAQQALMAAAGGAQNIGQMHTNTTNARIAREANKTTRYLAENAHQIQVRDLKKAGLNPILSATKGGSGAQVPQQQIARMENPMQDVVNSASTAMRMSSELESISANTELARATARKADQEAETQASIRDTNSALQGKHQQGIIESKAAVRRIDKEVDQILTKIKEIEANTRLIHGKAKTEMLSHEKKKLVKELYEKAGEAKKNAGEGVDKMIQGIVDKVYSARKQIGKNIKKWQNKKWKK